MKTVFSIRTCDVLQVLEQLYNCYKYVTHFLESENFNYHLSDTWSIEQYRTASTALHKYTDFQFNNQQNYDLWNIKIISVNGIFGDKQGDSVKDNCVLEDWQMDVLDLLARYVTTVEDQFYKLFTYPSEFYDYYDSVINDFTSDMNITNQCIIWHETYESVWDSVILINGYTLPTRYKPIFKFFTTCKLFLKQIDHKCILLPYVHDTKICDTLSLCFFKVSEIDVFYPKQNFD